MLQYCAVNTNQQSQVGFSATAEVSQSVPEDSQAVCTRHFHSNSACPEEGTLMWQILAHAGTLLAFTLHLLEGLDTQSELFPSQICTLTSRVCLLSDQFATAEYCWGAGR